MSSKKTHFHQLGFSFYQHPDLFGKWLGYKISKIDKKNRRVITTLKIRKEHLSSAQKVHGGVIAAFLDFTCGVAVFTTLQKNDFSSTVEIKVNYLKPLEMGDQLTAEAEVVFRGKRLCVLQGRLFKSRQKKVPVALVTATFNIVSPKTT